MILVTHAVFALAHASMSLATITVLSAAIHVMGMRSGRLQDFEFAARVCTDAS